MSTHIHTAVFFAPLLTTDVSIVHPIERYTEIITSKSAKTRAEKYCVWKLLEKIVSTQLKLDFANLRFTKTDNGQWICPDFCFSLSHTDGLVCVAISKEPIGVDVERMRPVREELCGRILTEREYSYMQSVPGEQRGVYLLESWVKKESIFKMHGGKALLPNRIETCEYVTDMHRVTIGDEEYLISACAQANEKTQFIYVEEI